MAHRNVPRLIAALIAAGLAGPATAHSVGASGSGDGRIVQPLLAALLLTGAFLYAAGAKTLWSKAGAWRGISRPNVACFVLGWASLAAALLSSIDAWASDSFAVHMIQHELLMIVAAPLIVLGRPLEAWAWGLPRRWQRAAARALRGRALRRVAPLLTTTLGAWTTHAVMLWAWHLPVLFKAALLWFPLHIVQHTCFLVSALGFWWSAFGGRARVAGASSVASLFTTMLHTSALGALLTFAPTAWYSLNADSHLGLTPLEDQQLGGLVMWIPGGFAYMVAALAVIRRWLREPHSAIRPARPPAPTVAAL